MSHRPPKHIAAAYAAAREVLGDRVTLEFRGRAKHRWRLACGYHRGIMSGSPANREDEARYARQWAQRIMKETEQ